MGLGVTAVLQAGLAMMLSRIMPKRTCPTMCRPPRPSSPATSRPIRQPVSRTPFRFENPMRYAAPASPVRTPSALTAGLTGFAFRSCDDEHPQAALRARVCTEVALEFFRAEHGRDPIDAREMAATIAKGSRPPTQTVAGYDLTFSPVKSVSSLWAVADPHVAALIEQAHLAAVRMR
jgi:TrwC relaxase